MDIRVVTKELFGTACLAALLEAVHGVANPVVGLPTGNTPVALFVELDRAVRAQEVDISKWRPFAIDEYGGPREHPCSNRAFFKRYWDSIPGAQPVTQFEPESTDTEAECTRMRSLLEEAGGLTISLLGIGLNGHLAFNEPGSLRDSSVRRVKLHAASQESAAACWGPDTPKWGLTLGLRELLAARSVIVMVNGASKAHIAGLALSSRGSPGLPASFARRRNAVWILDGEAAPGFELP